MLLVFHEYQLGCLQPFNLHLVTPCISAVGLAVLVFSIHVRIGALIWYSYWYQCYYYYYYLGASPIHISIHMSMVPVQ